MLAPALVVRSAKLTRQLGTFTIVDRTRTIRHVDSN
jgi:hypothetical protein